MRTIALSLCALAIGGVIGGPAARAQIQETTILSESARLEQIVAPVALYPDTLLMQVLMAATYPLEVVEAERLARENSGLQAEAVQASLANLDWDPSVKALVGYPDVLAMMSENLDWTRDLGDAFLRDQAGLLDAVQRMRQRARDAGTLTTTPEQVVTVRTDRIIVVEPATAVVYVPAYSPFYVYGGWSSSYWCYPRLYRRWPRSGFSFFVGFGNWAGWGGSWFYGRPDWRWGRSSVCIDVDIYNRFNRRHGYHWSDRDLAVRDRGQWGSWNHRPEHRRGVEHRDPQVAERFGERPRANHTEARRFEAPLRDRRERATIGKSIERSSPGRIVPERKDNTPTRDFRAPLSRTEDRDGGRQFSGKSSAPHRVEAPKIDRGNPPAVNRPAPQVRSHPIPNRGSSRIEGVAPPTRTAPISKAPASRFRSEPEARRSQVSPRPPAEFRRGAGGADRSERSTITVPAMRSERSAAPRQSNRSRSGFNSDEGQESRQPRRGR